MTSLQLSGSAPPEEGWVWYHCGQKGHFCRECPNGGQPKRQPRPPLGCCPLCKSNHWRSKSTQMEGGVLPPMDWWALGSPVQAPLNINVEEPWVTIKLEKQKIIFLLNSGAHFSVFPFSPSPWSNNKVIIRGISGQPLDCYFTWPLVCSWGDLHFCHSFS
jgi:hypothetical protein